MAGPSAAGGALRVMLDSMIPDVLSEDEALLLRLGELVEDRRLDILLTHVQVDELIRTPDAERRTLLLHPLFMIGARSVMTAVTVFGDEPDATRPPHRQAFAGSRLGMTRFGDGEPNEIYTRLIAGRAASEIEDALIVVTAHCERAVLVTNERRTGRIRAVVPDLVIWSSSELREWAFAQG